MIFRKKEKNPEISVDDDAIVAMADGIMFPIDQVKDEVFAQKMMGDGVAFSYNGDDITLCSPANGVLSVLFPTGHAYGITMKDGTELLVHIGIDTVEAKGEGFRTLGIKQGDPVKAGQPIVKVDLKKLGKTYDMSTMLIVTHNPDKKIHFENETRPIKCGERIQKQAEQ